MALERWVWLTGVTQFFFCFFLVLKTILLPKMLTSSGLGRGRVNQLL